MPTAALHTFNTNKLIPFYHPEDAQAVHFKFPNSTTIVAGTVVGELTATPGSVAAYSNVAADGSETARGVVQYDVTVDGSGNHTWGGSLWGETYKSAPVFISGYFKTTDLTGLDAPAIADLGRLVHGVLADGVLAINGS
jgi:hypothetical protein